MRVSIRWKLMSLFVAVVLISAGLTSVWLHKALHREFSGYVEHQVRAQARVLIPLLTSYYREHGSWEGVGRDFRRRLLPSIARRSPAPSSLLVKTRIVLLDEKGKTVWDSSRPMGTPAPFRAENPENAIPVVVDGKVVGKLLVLLPDVRRVGAVEQRFLSSMDRSIVLAAALAGVLALLLGGVLAALMTKPLRTLAEAASDVAEGRFSRRVEVSSKDEIGDLEDAFNKMASTLEQEEIQRKKLMADIAHELRTPLSVIKGNLEAILDGVYEPSTQNLAPVYEETLLLERLVSDLRELSLVESGKLRLEKRDVRLEEIARQAVGFFEPQAEEKKISMELSVSPGLPSIHGDPQRLRQVIHNLLSNALRYTPKGGRVSVSVRLLGGRPLQVAVSVSDTGPGIPPEDLPLIFDRFFRGDPSRARKSGGTGLGLVISKELVEAHGGRIWVESTPGQGTTVTFAIPVPGIREKEEREAENSR
jgi:two-component system OmpR family sensor kinase/two-component system sensor histidine kinase BaeS